MNGRQNGSLLNGQQLKQLNKRWHTCAHVGTMRLGCLLPAFGSRYLSQSVKAQAFSASNADARDVTTLNSLQRALS